jgi:hypothetical protein
VIINYQASSFSAVKLAVFFIARNAAKAGQADYRFVFRPADDIYFLFVSHFSGS